MYSLASDNSLWHTRRALGHEASMTPASRTDRSWALLPHGLLVFERAAPARPSRMLISRLESCSAPECTYREVGLRGVTLDVGDDITPDVLASEALRAMLASPDSSHCTNVGGIPSSSPFRP